MAQKRKCPAQVAVIGLGKRGSPMAASIAKECLRQSDAVVIAVPWQEFARLPEKALARRTGRLVVIDAWRIAPEPIRRKTKSIPVGLFSAFNRK